MVRFGERGVLQQGLANPHPSCATVEMNSLRSPLRNSPLFPRGW